MLYIVKCMKSSLISYSANKVTNMCKHQLPTFDNRQHQIVRLILHLSDIQFVSAFSFFQLYTVCMQHVHAAASIDHLIKHRAQTKLSPSYPPLPKMCDALHDARAKKRANRVAIKVIHAKTICSKNCPLCDYYSTS